MFKRFIFAQVLARLQEPKRFIQILAGPRQVGKTTLIQQVIKTLEQSYHYASADDINSFNETWIEQQWEIGRIKARKSSYAILVLDEIQKITKWSETIKKLWDEDLRNNIPLKVVLLGSSKLLIQQGLTESLAGRFEIIPITHWSFVEMQQAFNWTLEQYIFFGAYPGAAPLINDEARWSNYIRNSLIETTISRDILLVSSVKKPSLLRQLFQLGCHYSGQILSFQKMLGQLQDAGNTTTLSHYLKLLENAGMLAGIDKFSARYVRQRASSPKLQVLNTALISAQSNIAFNAAQLNREYWGRLVESTVGAYLLNNIIGKNIELFYWRELSKEIDFVLRYNSNLIAIEVKSGITKNALPGMKTFKEKYNPKHILLIGGNGIPLKEFLQIPIEHWCK
ncbi:MAG: ATP-binding protein [Gammaproteobacteria bacterium]